MHCVKTGLGAPGAHPDPAYAHRPRTLRTGSAHCAVSWRVVVPYRGVHRSRIVAQHRPCRRPPGPYRRAHACAMPHISQPPAPYRGAPWPYRSPWLPCIATHGRPLSATIQFCIVTRSQRPGPCTRAARPTYRPTVSWPSDGRVVAESWPCRGPLAAPRPAFPASVSRYKLLYRDPVHAENGAQQQPATFPFFFHHFFFIPATGKSPKKIILFFFIFQ